MKLAAGYVKQMFSSLWQSAKTMGQGQPGWGGGRRPGRLRPPPLLPPTPKSPENDRKKLKTGLFFSRSHVCAAARTCANWKRLASSSPRPSPGTFRSRPGGGLRGVCQTLQTLGRERPEGLGLGSLCLPPRFPAFHTVFIF